MLAIGDDAPNQNASSVQIWALVYCGAGHPLAAHVLFPLQAALLGGRSLTRRARATALSGHSSFASVMLRKWLLLGKVVASRLKSHSVARPCPGSPIQPHPRLPTGFLCLLALVHVHPAAAENVTLCWGAWC